MAITTIPNSSLSEQNNFVKIKTQTVSSAVASVSFKDGVDDVVFDSTYKYYKLLYRDVFGSVDQSQFEGQVSTDGGANFLTSGYLSTTHRTFYNGTTSNTGQNTYNDRFKITNMYSSNSLAEGTHNGEMTCWNPSETGKNAIVSYFGCGYEGDYAINSIGHTAITTDGDINAVTFFMSSGNISGGTFTLYGVRE